MPIDLFWSCTLTDLHYYLDVYKERYETKQEEKDYISWLNGMYIMYAIGSCLSKETKYPEKPMSFNEVEKKKLTIEELRQIEENKIRQYMSGGGTNGR